MPDHSLSPEPMRTMADVQITEANGFVVVSRWASHLHSRHRGAPTYEYETRDTLNDAFALFRDYESGEWARASAIGIFAVKDGLPFGPALPLGQIAAATQEARQDRRADGEHARHFGRPSL
jgi:hypothetical protein